MQNKEILTIITFTEPLISNKLCCANVDRSNNICRYLIRNFAYFPCWNFILNGFKGKRNNWFTLTLRLDQIIHMHATVQCNSKYYFLFYNGGINIFINSTLIILARNSCFLQSFSLHSTSNILMLFHATKWDILGKGKIYVEHKEKFRTP